MPMRVVSTPLYNAYGAYGLAVDTRPGGDRCVYAWQWIDDVRQPGSRARMRWWPAAAARGVPASVRVRLCRSGVMADQLAGYVGQLGIDLSRRAGAVQPPAAPAAAAPPAQPGPEPEAQPAAAPSGPPERPDAAPAAPKRRTARTRAEQPRRAEPAAPAPAVAQGPDGRRYLAPVRLGQSAPLVGAYAPAPTAAGVPSPNSGATPSRQPARTAKALDPSLPAQAYLGPASGTARGRSKPLASADDPPSPYGTRGERP